MLIDKEKKCLMEFLLLLQFLQKDMPALFDTDPDLLTNCAYQVKYNAKKMKK